MRFARGSVVLGALALLATSCHVPELTYADDLPVDLLDAAATDEVTAMSDGPLTGADEEGHPTALDPGDATDEPADTPDGRPSGPRGTCNNGVIDVDETGIDCGGPECPRCRGGRSCNADSDCVSAFCHRGECAQASCVDRVKNLKETDIDCGGGDCPPCKVGATCSQPEDCTLQNCVQSKCQPTSCDDNVRTSGESDVDCGGVSCAPCAAGKKCLLGRDCESRLCPPDGTCEAATCSDGARNGSETDQNCGGPSCPPCRDGKTCATGADCGSGVCATVCQSPSCNDQVKNGSETDVDCGGTCPTSCGPARRCTVAGDCASGNCDVTCQRCPRDMVAVTASLATYCIDTTEVTVAAYARFLQGSPRPSSIPAMCAHNTTYQPSSPLDLTSPEHPVNYVDWCDAATYCAERGRHLCGRVGGGAPLLASELATAGQSEWFAACTGPGALAFPYGNVFAPALCSGADRQPASGLWTTGGNPCEGSVAGLFDMSGNVAEWEDNCTGTSGAADACEVRGGSYAEGGSDGAQLGCSAVRAFPRSTGDNPAIGFRCCL